MNRGIAKQVLWASATVVNATATITSGVIDLGQIYGDACGLEVVVSGAGVHDLNIAQLVASAIDGTYRVPYDSAGTDIGEVYDALAATKWIQFTPALGKYMKLTITGDGANAATTAVQVNLIFQSSKR